MDQPFAISVAVRRNSSFANSNWASSLATLAWRVTTVWRASSSRGLRLVELRVGFGRVDTGDDAPGRNDVALVRNDLDNAPGYLRRNVDLGGLDPAVDADDALRQAGRL